jgi:histidinol dehydrogenase
MFEKGYVKIKTVTSEKKELVSAILERSHELNEEAMATTRDIVEQVRLRGMDALFEYTKKFDGAGIVEENFKVSKEEIVLAYEQVEDEVVESLRRAHDNIASFHARQKHPSNMETDQYGNTTGQIIRALNRVGCYVPGGTAAYPSSVLMTAVPAKVAGVKEIVMVTPPGKDGKINPYSLVAADLAGVTEIYKVGGAQAVAALAYGAGPLTPVDKIVGPGNIYVTLAKKLVYGTVDIDMLAGPSEILVVADETAEASFVAADMLSQAEHDKLASAILITDSEKLVAKVKKELAIQLALLPRKEIAEISLTDHGAIILTENIEEAVDLANDFAPEHLELCLAEPFAWVGRIKNAGALFLGNYTPEPLGDYFAGPNHVLPTSGTARFYSPLNLDTYQKKMSLIAYTKEGLMRCGEDVVRLATKEGLDAHARSVAIRMDKEKK